MGGFEHIRALVGEGEWGLTGHADRGCEDEGWDDRDIEACVASGRLRKRERDERPTRGCDGWEYTIVGRAHSGSPFYVVAKRVERPDRSWFVKVITAHRGR